MDSSELITMDSLKKIFYIQILYFIKAKVPQKP